MLLCLILDIIHTVTISQFIEVCGHYSVYVTHNSYVLAEFWKKIQFWWPFRFCHTWPKCQKRAWLATFLASAYSYYVKIYIYQLFHRNAYHFTCHWKFSAIAFYLSTLSSGLSQIYMMSASQVHKTCRHLGVLLVASKPSWQAGTLPHCFKSQL